MSNIIIVFWFTLSIFFGLLAVEFEEAKRYPEATICGVVFVIVFIGLLGLAIWIGLNEEEKNNNN